MTGTLDRRIGVVPATAIGLSAMVGAGLFVVFPPAVDAAGDGRALALAVVLAAAVAGCNAISSARLARRHPVAGGTYAYGRAFLGPWWGFTAGWAFVVGKLASCAAMASAVGSYAWPDHPRATAVATVTLVVSLTLGGVERSARVAAVLVVGVVLVVLVAAVTMLTVPSAGPTDTSWRPGGVLSAAGLLFFAFAGYARLATLGEEVRDPVRTIGRAIGAAMVVAVVLYSLCAIALVRALGPVALATSDQPFVDGLTAAGAPGMGPAVTVAAVVAAGGALLSLSLGVSRTTFAMARDGELPAPLAAVSERARVPHVAEIAVGVIVCAIVLTGQLATSIAFSSFCVLVYYAVANLCALSIATTRAARVLPAAGLIGCLVLAASLPTVSVVSGLAVLATGLFVRWGRLRLAARRA